MINTSRRAQRAQIPTPRPTPIQVEVITAPDLPLARDPGGRPSAAELAANPPVPVESIEIQQPPRIGIKNPPCCGRAMAPRDAKRISPGRYRCTCSSCGKRLLVTYDLRGYPVMARVL